MKYIVVGKNYEIFSARACGNIEDAEWQASRLDDTGFAVPYTICELVPVKTIAAPVKPKERWAVVDVGGNTRGGHHNSKEEAEQYVRWLLTAPVSRGAPYRVFKINFEEA